MLKREDYTIGQWMDLWMEVYAKPRCRETTLEAYTDSRRRLRVLFPGLEATPLEDLKPFDFQRCLNTLAERYAKSTVSHIRSLYNQAYNEAIRNRVCAWNPINGTTVPQNAKEKKVTALSQDEQRAFEAALRRLPTMDRFALYTFLYTGLRRGELINLKWEDWNERRNVLLIRQSKTQSGIREIPVIPEVSFILMSLRLLKGSRSCPYIFTFQGGQMKAHHLRWICEKASELAGIRHVHPHVLRHSFASRMIERKVNPKSLSVIIGHSNVAFTMRTYVDVDKDHHLREEMMKLSSVSAKR